MAALLFRIFSQQNMREPVRMGAIRFRHSARVDHIRLRVCVFPAARLAQRDSAHSDSPHPLCLEPHGDRHPPGLWHDVIKYLSFHISLDHGTRVQLGFVPHARIGAVGPGTNCTMY